MTQARSSFLVEDRSEISEGQILSLFFSYRGFGIIGGSAAIIFSKRNK